MGLEYRKQNISLYTTKWRNNKLNIKKNSDSVWYAEVAIFLDIASILWYTYSCEGGEYIKLANISEVFTAQMDSMNFALQSFTAEQDEIHKFWQSGGKHKEIFIMPSNDFCALVVEVQKPTTKRRIGFLQ